MDELLEATALRIFADVRLTPDTLWAALEKNGLTRVWVGAADGGFEMAPSEGFGLMRLAGANGLLVPFTETLLASWFLGEAKLHVPKGQLSVVIDGAQRGIAFGGSAGHIVRVSGCSVTLHRGGIEGVIDGVGADPLADASKLDNLVIAAGDMPIATGLLFAALARSAQLCGAIDAVLDLTIGFAEQREQFGRSLSKFQAIQHLLSEMGCEAAAASAMLDLAVSKVDRGCALDPMTIASAKYRAGVAAGIVADHAHQIHGAIGYTDEYALARLTRRLWQWRDDFGGETYWANELGRAALAEPGPLWPVIADGKG